MPSTHLLVVAHPSELVWSLLASDRTPAIARGDMSINLFFVVSRETGRRPHTTLEAHSLSCSSTYTGGRRMDAQIHPRMASPSKSQLLHGHKITEEQPLFLLSPTVWTQLMWEGGRERGSEGDLSDCTVYKRARRRTHSWRSTDLKISASIEGTGEQ